MRIENFSPKTPFSHLGASSEQDKKTDEVARKVLVSLPTAGIEPVTTAILVGIGGFIAGVFYKTLDKVADKTAEKVEGFVYPTEETDPFKMKSCVEAYNHSSWSGSDLRKKKLPDPIFEPTISKMIEDLRRAPQDALDSNKILPSAIISGPVGTGKTTACEGIARGGDWNYFLLTGNQFIGLLQDEETVNRFFKDVRNEKRPTVFVVDGADNLFQSDSDDATRALQKFKVLTSTRDHKAMFLFVTEVPLNEITDRAFLSRMTYQVTVKMPGPEELKKILLQQAKRLLKAPVLESFTPEVCESLANSIFKGKSGRDVESALMTINDHSHILLKTQLQDHFKRYFNEYRI